MALSIEYVSVSELRAYDKNARTHSPDQVAQIVASINEFGFTNPVLIDENNELIAGHGRTQAAQSMGLEQVPAIRLSGLSDQQKKALRIADNQLALNAGWDLDLLMQEVQSLDLDGFDLDVLGFSDEYMSGLLNGEIGEDGNEDGDEDSDGGGDGGGSDRGIEYQEKYSIVVECADEREQAELYDRLTEMGLTCRVLVN